MSLRKIVAIGALSLAVGFPVAALARATLQITNNTNYDSASYVNNWLCSSKIKVLPENTRVTKRHSSTTLSYLNLYAACAGKESSCTADIYGNADCQDASPEHPIGKIGTATINTDTGLQRVDVTDPRFAAQWDLTHVTINCSASNPELCS